MQKDKPHQYINTKRHLEPKYPKKLHQNKETSLVYVFFKKDTSLLVYFFKLAGHHTEAL